ncbi:MAG: PilZ domain-containing protein [Bacteroidota bacterium]
MRYFGDKRKFERYQLEGKALLRIGAAMELVILAELIDVSLDGVGIKVSLEQSRSIRMTSTIGYIQFNTDVFGTFGAYADIVRSTKLRGGLVSLGLRFLSIEDDEYRKLHVFGIVSEARNGNAAKSA